LIKPLRVLIQRLGVIGGTIGRLVGGRERLPHGSRGVSFWVLGGNRDRYGIGGVDGLREGMRCGCREGESRGCTCIRGGDRRRCGGTRSQRSGWRALRVISGVLGRLIRCRRLMRVSTQHCVRITVQVRHRLADHQRSHISLSRHSRL
jgi:hypothetical protein